MFLLFIFSFVAGFAWKKKRRKTNRKEEYVPRINFRICLVPLFLSCALEEEEKQILDNFFILSGHFAFCFFCKVLLFTNHSLIHMSFCGALNTVFRISVLDVPKNTERRLFILIRSTLKMLQRDRQIDNNYALYTH